MLLRTARLSLVASTAALSAVERDGERLAAALGPHACGAEAVRVREWPPDALRAALGAWTEALAARPELSGWFGWYWLAGAELVGYGGFKGEPEQGAVELGYAVLPAWRRRGYAREAVTALCGWALADPRAAHVDAETQHDNTASVGLLERCGFRRLPQTDPAVLRFRLER